MTNFLMLFLRSERNEVPKPADEAINFALRETDAITDLLKQMSLEKEREHVADS